MDHGMSSFEPARSEDRTAPLPAAIAFTLALFQAWILGRLRRLGDVTVEAPTGAGKTLMLRTLVGLDLGRPGGFTRVIISAPQEQIERGFLLDTDMEVSWPAGVAAQPTLRIPARLIRAARRDGCGTRRSIARYLAAEGRSYALACTHAALNWLEDDDLPADLRGCVLVIDEAHHAPARGLARVASLWRARGGRLIYCTATPYRMDGQPVVLEGMAHLRRSMAQHMEEGWAPRTLSGEIVALGRRNQRVTTAQFTGDEAPPGSYTEITARALVDKWFQDGRPKVIVRVPPGRGPLVRRVVDAFTRAGARVLDASGVEKERKRRFLAALDDERRRTFDTSRVDVVVGIQRVLEGTDWPICSSVYSIGIPRSLQLVVQFAGRALRKKAETYPESDRDRARVTFFVPSAGGVAASELSLDHSRHVLLVAAYMTDHVVGQAWIVTSAVQRGLRAALVGRTEDELDNALDATEAAGDPAVRADVQLALVAVQQDLAEAGEPVTAAALMDHVRSARPDLPEAVLEQVTVELLASLPETAAAVTSRLEQETAARLRIDPQVQEAMQAAFSAVLAEFRAATLEDSPVLAHLGQQIHTLTGGAMRHFAARLAAAMPRPLTNVLILGWADAHRARTGAWPSAVSGPVHGVPGESWGALDRALRLGGRGLPPGSSVAQLLDQHRGAANHLAPRHMTETMIEGWARLHDSVHGRYPSRSSGAIPDTPFTWCAVDVALKRGLHGLPGGMTLARFLELRLGARNISRLIPLTDALVAGWARRFLDEHGRWPLKTDGQIAGAAPGETWARIAASIVQGRRGIQRRTSLRAFLHEVCCAPAPRVRRSLTLSFVLERAHDYRRREGRWPNAASVDPALERFGETWHRIDRALRTGGRGLPKTTLLELEARYGRKGA